jgi:hypothetical protein
MSIVIAGAIVIYETFHQDLWWYGSGLAMAWGATGLLGEKSDLADPQSFSRRFSEEWWAGSLRRQFDR